MEETNICLLVQFSPYVVETRRSGLKSKPCAVLMRVDSRTSLVVQWWRLHFQCRECGFDPWFWGSSTQKRKINSNFQTSFMEKNPVLKELTPSLMSNVYKYHIHIYKISSNPFMRSPQSNLDQ